MISTSILLSGCTTISMGTHTPALRTGTQSASVDCLLYATADEHHDKTQLLSVDLFGKTTLRLGNAAVPRLTGLAIDPTTRALYAISEGDEGVPTQLYRVDSKTGVLSVVGPVGFTRLRGLSYRSADAKLWSISEHQGLVSIDPITGKGTLALSEKEPELSSLSWTDDGTRLYAAGEEHRRLWVYDPRGQGLKELPDRLPDGSRTIQVRPDGNLLVLRDSDDDKCDKCAAFLVYNLQTHSVVNAFHINKVAPQDLRAIAWPNQCGNPDPGGQIKLIQQISVDKTTLCPNDEVKVTVVAQHPDGPPNPVDVAINQFLGATQYVQFTGAPGTRRIAVSATTFERYVDRGELTVAVANCPAVPLPVVRMNPSTFYPDTVEFTIANPGDLPQLANYQWDFGDGQTATTSSRFIAHDYSASVPGDAQHAFFTASVTVAPGQTTHKSVALLSRYSFNKRLGVLQPPVRAGAVTSVAQLPNSGGPGMVGDASIRNLEDTAVTFTDSVIEYQPCNVDQPSSTHPFTDNFTVGPQQQVQRQVVLGTTVDLNSDVCGVAVHYSGTDGRGIPAVAHLYYSVRDNLLMRQYVRNPQTIQVLKQVASLRSLPDNAVITDEDIHTMARNGQIAAPTGPASGQSTFHTAGIQTGAPDPGGVPLPQGCDNLTEPKLGDPCNPECAAIRPGLVCAVADGDTWWADPAHIQNAQKGDVVMSPGCGKIGALLHSISQHFSHDGIMTRDRYEVTDSTASEEVLSDDAVHDGLGGSAGITPAYLKYAWPGAIRQSIDEAFISGTNLTFDIGSSRVTWSEHPLSPDPEACSGDSQLFYPQVARGDPARRDALHHVADMAAKDGDNVSTSPGKFFESQFHYRFFSYSRGDIGGPGNGQFLSQASFSQGTRPSVCSSFIWNVLGDIGMPVGPREPDAHNMGMLTMPDTPSGLFFYSEVDRRAAAMALYNSTFNNTADKGGVLGRSVGAPQNYATQITSCFAFDNCEHDYSNPRFDPFSGDPRNFSPGAGNAVSPDNILLWDIYPTNEPIIFRQNRFRRATTWQATAGTGCITGQVVDTSNQPVAAATVVIMGLQRRDGENVSTQSDASGNFSFQAIPILVSGKYLLSAQKTVTGTGFEEGSAETNAAEPSCANQSIVLQPPVQLYRRVTVCGTIHVDDQGENSATNQDALTMVCHVNQADPVQHVPAKLQDDAGYRQSHAPNDEFDATVNATCTLKTDNSVTVHLNSSLDGCESFLDITACGHSNVQERNDDLVLPPGQGQDFTAHLQNNFNDIWADFKLRLFNDCADCNTIVSCPK